MIIFLILPNKIEFMQKINIKKLGPIEDVFIELKGITVLIGEQATGKSTIAHCVHFFRSLSEDLIAEIFQTKRFTLKSEIQNII